MKCLGSGIVILVGQAFWLASRRVTERVEVHEQCEWSKRGELYLDLSPLGPLKIALHPRIGMTSNYAGRVHETQ